MFFLCVKHWVIHGVSFHFKFNDWLSLGRDVSDCAFFCGSDCGGFCGAFLSSLFGLPVIENWLKSFIYQKEIEFEFKSKILL